VLDIHLTDDDAEAALASDARTGLTAHPKSLPPKWFYDARGSELFEEITRLPEYYPTRTEAQILRTHAGEMVEGFDEGCVLIEFGAGSSTKTEILLDRAPSGVTYVPIDVSESALHAAKEHLEAEIPGLRVAACVADYTEGIAALPAEGRRIVLYIGSSIGNFDPDDAKRILREVRRRLAPGDLLLLGVDHVKDEPTLLRAYDDAAGVTAEFNKNILARINRELGANFNTRLFRHRAHWNAEQSRIEIYLDSLAAQRVMVPALDLEITLERGEAIHTENSYKFTPESIGAIIESAGFAVKQRWTDERDWFGVYLAASR
jgi:dimethylhistidine N-methyltransferase